MKEFGYFGAAEPANLGVAPETVPGTYPWTRPTVRRCTTSGIGPTTSGPDLCDAGGQPNWPSLEVKSRYKPRDPGIAALLAYARGNPGPRGAEPSVSRAMDPHSSAYLWWNCGAGPV